LNIVDIAIHFLNNLITFTSYLNILKGHTLV